MSARSRGRVNPNQDADDERRLWKEIRDKARDVDSMVARSNEIGTQILQVEMQQAALLEANKPSDASFDERLEKLYRENLKLCEDVQQIIEGNANETNLLDSLHILAAIRGASEESAAQAQTSATPRTASGKLNRAPKKAGSKASAVVAVSTEEANEASAAPSPRLQGGAANRLNAKEKTSRSGSIATTREASVKIEDNESVASSADGASTATAPTSKALGGSRPSNRIALKLNEIVFCRHDPKNFDSHNPPEGEGILCRVTKVIGEHKQRRYEVQDADTSGESPPPQRALISQLIQIPDDNKGLGDLPKGKQVLAQYPDTTTFYKAEVNETWKAKDLGDGEKSAMVRLNFQDDESSREVERRFVLTEK